MQPIHVVHTEHHATESLRDQRRRHTRAGIRAAALTLVRQHRLENVTVEMISAEAGVSVRTFFNYFPYKEAALVSGPPPLTDDAAAEFLAKRGREGPEENMNALLDDVEDLMAEQIRLVTTYTDRLASTMQIIDDHPQLMAPHLASFADLEQQLGILIAARLEPGDDVTGRLIAAVAIAAGRVALIQWSRRPDDSTADAQVHRCLRSLRTLFNGGLPADEPTPEGLAAPEQMTMPEEPPVLEQWPVPELRTAPEHRSMTEHRPVPEHRPMPEHRPAPEHRLMSEHRAMIPRQPVPERVVRR